ncbi:S-adenosyl-L-methionine-dependent methyltransferase [Sistotremastrum niveocremeum HHB9708]|uniref:S-adenosyl-L-methionine-dependent methyltransferase n=1 Tax=Sistotremastrum niveocremeum HHB9708 TaxID=1314777 RepID=A0A165ADW8_9AGAM|nr:S-adenosyl-L-methionine-dependent methyltransferase [Sistotremastrum niveocremeum HHB9708]
MSNSHGLAAPHHHDYDAAIAEPDLVKANEMHFDAQVHHGSASPHSEVISRVVGEAILDAYDFIEEQTTVLEFACGADLFPEQGFVFQILAPHCKSVLGVDISQGQVDEFNRRVENQGILPEEMKAIRGDLNGLGDIVGDIKFDLIFCASAYHHFSDIDAVTRGLAVFLKPQTGVLVVVDMLKTEHSASLHTSSKSSLSRQTVAHHGGFEAEEIEANFKQAGLADFEMEIAFEKEKGDKKLVMFIASGRSS